MSPMILDNYRRSVSPRSTFAVSPAKYEDIRRLVDIEFFAFEKEKTNHILSYRDHHQPAHFQRAVKLYEDAMSKSSSARSSPSEEVEAPSYLSLYSEDEHSNVCFRKVIDVDNGDLISWAKTEISAYTPSDLASPADIGHEDEPEMNREWFALNEQVKRDYMGTTKHCYIAMLATQPFHQHKGAGTMLLEDILGDADNAGIECYLEATDTAKPLYERHGFVAVRELRFDPAEYGIDGYRVERQTVMVRGALGPNGVRRPVRSWQEIVANL